MRNFCCARTGAAKRKRRTPVMHRSFILKLGNMQCIRTRFLLSVGWVERQRYPLFPVSIGVRLNPPYGAIQNPRLRSRNRVSRRRLRMHVLGEPVQRHFTAGAAFFCGVVDSLPYRSELRSHADVIDEPGDLTVRLSPFDLTENKFRQCR